MWPTMLNTVIEAANRRSALTRTSTTGRPGTGPAPGARVAVAGAAGAPAAPAATAPAAPAASAVPKAAAPAATAGPASAAPAASAGREGVVVIAAPPFRRGEVPPCDGPAGPRWWPGEP